MNSTNNTGKHYNSNIITAEQWDSLVQHGAVFLPAAGTRNGAWVEGMNDFGYYWMSSSNNDLSYNLDDYCGNLGLYSNGRNLGQSVRLVRPAKTNTTYTIEAVPNPTQGGTIIGVGSYEYYNQVTLTATANEGYTFYQWKENGNVISMENPYTFVALFDRNFVANFYENSTYPLTYSYDDEDHTATVTGREEGVKLEGELVIPETVMHNGEAYTVTAIAGGAFEGCSGLTSVVIPTTIISIEGNPFIRCSNLEAIVVEQGNAYYDSRNDCNAIIETATNKLVLGCQNTIIPNDVATIGESSFFGCSHLTTIAIPNSVTKIEGLAFHSCGLVSVSLSENLTEIGQWAFSSCTNLTSISIPNGVTSLGAQAFLYCYSLISASLPSGITMIPHGLFQSCGNLASITIPSGVTLISSYAFLGCYNLASLTVLSETPPVLDNESLGDIFIDVNKNIPVYIPCGTLETYQTASGWSEFTNFVEMCPGTVTVTASPAEYGTVTGGGFYEGSATCTVTAMPNEGCYFLCWMEDGQWISSQATYSFPVIRDRNLTAIFYATLGNELVVNGDFEQGNVGFTSEYNYNYDFDIGEYYVDNDAHGRYPGFGHGGTGKFMLIDGATEPGINVWTEQVSVVPNTYYVFSTWVCTLNPESMAMLQFSINGTQIGVFRAPSQTNIWEQFYALWYSSNSTTATITILDLNTERMGNDFGLDDISFRELNP